MIQPYFHAEKLGAQVALSIGILACAVGGSIMLGAGAPFFTGIAVPLVVVGIVQIMVGASVARRSDRQSEDLEKILADSPAEFRALETPRMQKVMRNFVRVKWLELVLIGLGLSLVLWHQAPNFPRGLGLGLLLQSGIMLIFDILAEKRGRAYTAFVAKQ